MLMVWLALVLGYIMVALLMPIFNISSRLFNRGSCHAHVLHGVIVPLSRSSSFCWCWPFSASSCRWSYPTCWVDRSMPTSTLPKRASKGRTSHRIYALDHLGDYQVAIKVFRALTEAPVTIRSGEARISRHPARDAWGTPLLYAYPGKKNTEGFDVYSAGPRQNSRYRRRPRKLGRKPLHGHNAKSQWLSPEFHPHHVETSTSWIHTLRTAAGTGLGSRANRDRRATLWRGMQSRRLADESVSIVMNGYARHAGRPSSTVFLASIGWKRFNLQSIQLVDGSQPLRSWRLAPSIRLEVEPVNRSKSFVFHRTEAATV